MHDAKGDRSLEEVIKETTSYFTAFPDIRATVEDMIAEGDKVGTRWTMHITHEAKLRRIPATPKQVIKGITIRRIANGKVVEEWLLMDRPDLVEQFGTIPSQ